MLEALAEVARRVDAHLSCHLSHYMMENFTIVKNRDSLPHHNLIETVCLRFLIRQIWE